MPKLSAKALMSALPYRIKEQTDEIAYRIYMSDVLITISKGMWHTKNEPRRYWDIINPPPEETRTPEEIITHMKNKLKKLEEPPTK